MEAYRDRALRRALGVLAAALVLAPLATVPTRAEAQVAGQVRVGANYRLGTERAAVRGRDVPSLTVNPADPNHIVETDEDLINGFCDFRVSFDGGRTWSDPGHLTAPAGFEPQACSRFDGGDYLHMESTAVKFGTGQNVYATFSWNRPGEGDSILVARSTNGGRTFATGVVAIQGSPQQVFTSDGVVRPEIAVQPRAQGDRIYVAAWGITTVGASLAVQERRTITSRSDDNGQTWTAPVDAQAPTEKAREQTEPVVAPNGDVYVGWRTQTATATETNFLVVARSTDLGQTWDRVNVRVLAGVRDSMPQIGVSPTTGTLFAVYEDPPAGDRDIQIQRSTDNGVTWSAPVRVNDDAPGTEQRVPHVSVAPNGRVDVVWHDRRHVYRSTTLVGAQPRGLGDTYYAYSTDDGRTFSANRRITDQTINLDVGLDPDTGTNTWYGPTVVPLGNTSLLFAWPDSREGNFNTDTQDIYLARAELAASAEVPVRQLADDNAGLSVALSRLAYPGGLQAQGATAATRVVVVNESDSASGLVGAVLARANWAPLLASPAAGMPVAMKAEVSRLQPSGAYLIGDEAALSPVVASDLVSSGVAADRIVRIAATSPAETAAAVALALDPRAEAARAAGTAAAESAVIVDPASPEAPAAAGLAASLRLPVLFVDRDSVPAATPAALEALAITRTLVIGGTGAISAATMSQLPSPTRLGGDGVYAASAAVVEESRARQLPTNVVYAANGARPMDAALVGAAAARAGGLLVLAPGAEAPAVLEVIDRLGLRAEVDQVVSVAGTGLRTGAGYWSVAADGGVFAFGGAPFLGSAGALRLSRPVVGMAPTRSGNGYWLVASDGGIFAFGDAVFRGSTGALRLNRPIVGMAPTPTGNGYWLVASDGGIFAFGDAVFRGSTGAIRLNRPVVGMTATGTGHGYRLVASDGGIFAFGDAPFLGSTGALRLNQPIVGIADRRLG